MTILSVGGSSYNVEEMTSMLSTPANREMFIADVISYLREWKFNGLDFHFEKLGMHGSPPEDKTRFTELCQVHSLLLKYYG